MPGPGNPESGVDRVGRARFARRDSRSRAEMGELRGHGHPCRAAGPDPVRGAAAGSRGATRERSARGSPRRARGRM